MPTEISTAGIVPLFSIVTIRIRSRGTPSGAVSGHGITVYLVYREPRISPGRTRPFPRLFPPARRGSRALKKVLGRR